MTVSEPTEPTPRSEERLVEDDPVFVRALECQMELMGQTFPDHESALVAARILTVELDELACENKITKESVILRGRNMHVMTPTLDLRTGLFSLAGNFVDNEEEPSFSGIFFGFEPRVYALNDDKTEFGVIIEYQVLTSKKWTLPGARCDTLVCGSVMTSELEFTRDTQRQDAVEASKVLDAIDDPLTAELVRELHERLSGDGRFDQNNLQRIALLIRTHLDYSEQPVSEHVKEALLDLIKAKLGLYDNQFFTINAVSAIEKNAGPKDDYTVRSNIKVMQSVSGVTFAPYYYEKRADGLFVMESTAAHSLSIIVEILDENGEPCLVTVPLDKIHTLQPIE